MGGYAKGEREAELAEMRRNTKPSGGRAMSVLDDVAVERKRQDEHWGGPGHDDELTLDTWAEFITKHIDRFWDALGELEASDSEAEALSEVEAAKILRHRAIVVAALMVALVESNDRTIYASPAATGGERRD